MLRTRTFLTTLALSTALSAGAALAQDPQSCQTVRFSDVGWTDITATTGVATVLLEALGYGTNVQVLSVPVTYASLKNGDIDVFLGNWMPTMEADIAPYREDGSVETLVTNLEGAKYTLAVPKYTYDKGLTSFDKIAEFRDDLNGQILGIEPGNDGNRLILDMIEARQAELVGFDPAGRRLPGLGAASDERQYRDGISRRRRRRVRSEFRRRDGSYQCARGLHRRMPECRQALDQSRLFPGDGERDHGRDPRRRRRP
jgi:hypothetical protein